MKRLNQSAFTISELAISVVMAGILAVLIGGITITFYGSVLRSDAEARMVVDSQIILRKIVDELRISSSVAPTNTIPDTYGPTGGWNTSTTDAILVINTPVIGDDGTFVIDDLTGSPYLNELVYFSEGDEMYRRVLANPTPTENSRVTTCPAENVGMSGCTVADDVLSEDYQDMIFVFYDQDDVVTTDTLLARSIDMTINLGRTIFGGDVEIENNIRITLRNEF